MNWKTILLALVLADFLALNVWVLAQYGPVDWAPAAVGNPAGILLAVDLMLALSIVSGWMWFDAPRHGLRAAPYIVATALTGSVGPLLYLIRRERARRIMAA
mgnify:CR=1 FL=1